MIDTVSFVPFAEKPGRPRRPPLDRQQVVAAALSLLDEVGLDELTMRRLASRLGVKAASLYKHVRDKEELLVLLADEVSGSIAMARGGGGLVPQVSEMARNYRRGLLAHRDAARLLAATAPLGPRRLRHIEALLRALRSAGLSARDSARAAYHLNNFVTEFVADEGRYAAAAAAMGSRTKLFAWARSHFAGLPRGDYPTLVELADYLAEDDPEGLFEFGVQMWLRSIARLATRAGPR